MTSRGQGVIRGQTLECPIKFQILRGVVNLNAVSHVTYLYFHIYYQNKMAAVQSFAKFPDTGATARVWSCVPIQWSTRLKLLVVVELVEYYDTIPSLSP